MRRIVPRALGFLLVMAVAVHAAAAVDGKAAFEQKCAACHTIGGGDRVGPDLHGVTERRSPEWLQRYVMAPDQMIAGGDPIAVGLYEKYNRIMMPNLGLGQEETQALLDHIRSASAAATPQAVAQSPAADLPRPELIAPQSTILAAFVILSLLVAAVFAWVALSTGRPAEVDVKKAYGVRRVLFGAAVLALVALLAVTLPRVPYAKAETKPDRIVHVAARQFSFVYSDEPILSLADLGQVATLERLELERGTLVEFRVTALDVNHGFGLYGPQRQLLAQTQAMPGYVNRLLVRLTEPGQYRVFCLEYCAAGHHRMQSEITVE